MIGAGEGVTGSLSASWDATQGHGWAIFLSAIILFVAISLCSTLVGAVFAFAGEPVVAVASGFAEAAASGVLSAFGIAVYCRVHDDAHEISEVFA